MPNAVGVCMAIALSRRAVTVAGDVADSVDVDELGERIESGFGGVDLQQ